MAYDRSSDALFRPSTRPTFVGVGDMPPLGTGSRFNRTDAWWMCGAAHAAYYGDRGVAAALGRGGLTLEATFERDAARAILASTSSGGDVILAFRGTNSDEIQNIRDDIDIRWTTLSSGARVHRGFHTAVDRIWSDIDRALRPHVARGARLWFTGHSLGGAMAALAAERLAPSHVCTIGAPRVGDDAFVEAFSHVSATRLYYCADVVPTVPQRLFGFRHVGEPWYIDRHARIHRNPTSSFVVGSRIRGGAVFAATRDWQSLAGSVVARSLADHAIVNYADALRSKP